MTNMTVYSVDVTNRDMPPYGGMDTVSPASDLLRGRVRDERERRGWSQRTASTKSKNNPDYPDAGVSNETWRRYERGGPLTAEMRRAIIAAFGWSADWAEGTPVSNGEELSRRLSALEEVVRRLLQEQRDRSQDMNAALRAVEERLDRLEQPGEQANDR